MAGNQVRITASVNDQASSSIDRLRDKWDKMRAQGAKGIAIGAGAAITAKALGLIGSAIDGIGGAIIGAGQKAAALEQAVGGTEAVFKGSADEIGKWAAKAADSAGLSETDFRTATTLIGGQLKRMSGDLDFATKHSLTLVQVAADLAATYGGTTKEAVEALGSAFRGEADPAERFNLNLKAGVVNAKAVEMGLAANTREVSEYAKAQALMALILEQSADAQGQFARELDTTAGATQRAQAKIDNAMAGIGGFVAKFQLGVIGVFDTFGRKVDEAGAIVSNFAADFGDQGERINGIAAETGQSFQTLKERIQKEMDASGSSFEEAATKIEMAAKVAAAGITENMSEGVRFGADALRLGGPVIAAEAGKIAGMFPSEIRARDKEIRAAAYNNIVSFAAGLLDAQNQPKVAMDALIRAQETALDRNAEINYLKGVLADERLAAGLNSEIDAVSAAARAVVTEATVRLDELGAEGYGAGTAGAEGVISGITGRIGGVGAAAAQLRGVGAQNMDMGSTPGVHGANAGARFGSGIASQYRYVSDKASGVAGGASYYLQAPGRQAYNWGVTLGRNFGSGLSSQYYTVYSSAAAVAAGASAALKIRSPAKAGPLSEDASIWGRKLVSNFASGMDRARSQVADAAKRVGGDAVLSGFVPPTLAGVGVGGPTTNGVSGPLIHIEHFHGTEENVANLGRQLGNQIRLSSGRRFING